MMKLLCIVLVGLLHVSGQYQSPCPNIFEYRIDQLTNTPYGFMRIKPDCRDGQLLTKVSFTIATRLQSSFVGAIIPLGDYTTNNCADQKSIEYRVKFPQSSPLPRITMISANGNTICSGPGDEMYTSNQYVSSVNLEHEIYFKTGSSVQYQQQYVHQKIVTQGLVLEEHAVENKYNITYDTRRTPKAT